MDMYRNLIGLRAWNLYIRWLWMDDYVLMGSIQAGLDAGSGSGKERSICDVNGLIGFPASSMYRVPVPFSGLVSPLRTGISGLSYCFPSDVESGLLSDCLCGEKTKGGGDAEGGTFDVKGLALPFKSRLLAQWVTVESETHFVFHIDVSGLLQQ